MWYLGVSEVFGPKGFEQQQHDEAENATRSDHDAHCEMPMIGGCVRVQVVEVAE